MTFSLFWDVTHRWLVAGYQRFETTYWSHLQRSSDRSPETSVAKYPSTLRNIAIVKALFNGCLFNMIACLSAMNLMGHGRTWSWPNLIWYTGNGVEALKKTAKHLVEIIDVPAGNQT